MGTIKINKNRGWRGLAEIEVDCETIKQKMIFSFSEQVWQDMLSGHIVMQDENNYYVIVFETKDRGLPSKFQQRSVLIKNFTSIVTNVFQFEKSSARDIPYPYNLFINHFTHNKNNHTTSDWNYIRNTCHSIYII